MQKLVLIFGTVILIFFIIASCKKNSTQPPPVQPSGPSVPNPPADSLEIKSSQEIAELTLLVSDIDLMMGMPAANELVSSFYSHKPGSLSPMEAIRDEQNYAALIYANTLCNDGKIRDGEVKILWRYDAQLNPLSTGVDGYGSFGFKSYILFKNFSIDGVKVDNFDPNQPVRVSSKISSANYDPKTENVTWETKGKLIFTRPDGKTFTWDGLLIKELLNTADSVIFNKDLFGGYVLWINRNFNMMGLLPVC